VACCLLTAGTCAEPPDADAATYWQTAPPGSSSDEVPGLLAVRRLAGATRAPSGALVPLRLVAGALRSAVGRLGDDVLAFQGHVLSTGDFLATWAVELAVHQLDLAREIDVARPTPAALGLARRTVESVAGAGLPVPAFAERLPGPTTDGRT
jgi:hypothetical protein